MSARRPYTAPGVRPPRAGPHRSGPPPAELAAALRAELAALVRELAELTARADPAGWLDVADLETARGRLAYARDILRGA